MTATGSGARSAGLPPATADTGRNSGPGEVGAEAATGSDGVPSAVPRWLADLARSAAQMPVPAGLRPPATGGRHSAILILFGCEPHAPDLPDRPDLLLVQRSNSLRRHAGQPAFPGGVIDDDDDGPVGAALREAAEEARVDPAGVDVVTLLPDLYIARTGYRVSPVLGWWREPAPVVPGDPAEVASVARVPVAELADPDHRIMIRYPSGQAGPAFLAAGMLIWGFTAFVIERLLEMGGWELPWDAGRVTDLPPGMTLTGVDGAGPVN